MQKLGNVPVHGQFARYLIQRANIAELELLSLHALHVARLGVSAQLDSAAGIDLGHAEGHCPRGGLRGVSRAVRIRPVYGTESRRTAMSRLN